MNDGGREGSGGGGRREDVIRVGLPVSIAPATCPLANPCRYRAFFTVSQGRFAA